MALAGFVYIAIIFACQSVTHICVAWRPLLLSVISELIFHEDSGKTNLSRHAKTHAYAIEQDKVCSMRIRRERAY